MPRWFLDGDADGLGDPAAATEACDAPADHVGNGADCNDDDGNTGALRTIEVHLQSAPDVIFAGTTTGLGDDAAPSCIGGGTPDATHSFVAPRAAPYAFTVLQATFDAAVEVLPCCSEEPLQCNDDANANTTLPAARLLLAQDAAVNVVVDSFGGSGDYTLRVAEIRPEECGNGVDDDVDLREDCVDRDCAADPLCGEICDNGGDDDGDGLGDCEDPGCQDAPGCENCADSVDNNADEAVDCADYTCKWHPACRPPDAGEIPGDTSSCSDNLDNDGDGRQDCGDSDCVPDVGCLL